MDSQLKIDDRTHLEAGIRVMSTPQNWRQLETILGADSRLKWARSAAHSSAKSVWKLDTGFGGDGYVPIPDEHDQLVADNGGFLMLKIVSTMDSDGDYFVGAGRFNSAPYDFDRVQARREDGSWVYSIPIHNLGVGGGPKFFFLMRFERIDEETAKITIDKIVVTRGKSHFRVRVEAYHSLIGYVQMLHKTAERNDKIRDLPIASFLYQVKHFAERPEWSQGDAASA
jgi:hypothetical protein